MSLMTKSFCVYGHYDALGNLRYLGMGSRHRAFSCRGRNDDWRLLFSKAHPPKIRIFYDGISREEAYGHEADLILAASSEGLPIVNRSCGQVFRRRLIIGHPAAKAIAAALAWPRLRPDLLISARKDRYI